MIYAQLADQGITYAKDADLSQNPLDFWISGDFSTESHYIALSDFSLRLLEQGKVFSLSFENIDSEFKNFSDVQRTFILGLFSLKFDTPSSITIDDLKMLMQQSLYFGVSDPLTVDEVKTVLKWMDKIMPGFDHYFSELVIASIVHRIIPNPLAQPSAGAIPAIEALPGAGVTPTAILSSSMVEPNSIVVNIDSGQSYLSCFVSPLGELQGKQVTIEMITNNNSLVDFVKWAELADALDRVNCEVSYSISSHVNINSDFLKLSGVAQKIALALILRRWAFYG